jgi:uncharacterized protein (DUF2336 family)
MPAALAIISEVESALSGASSEKRTDILRRVTDLFVAASDNCSEAQADVFDGVMGQLVSHVESRAAIELSHRLSSITNAPRETVRRLAHNDDIEIAAPVLSRSSRLTDNDIIEIAKLKSQAHLAKIAARPLLSSAVTDVLVDYGNAKVANELVTNTGAQFSKLGMAKLVMRADGDEQLTQSIAARHDIPPRQFQQLLMQATEIVRKKLLADASPERKEIIQQVLADISAQSVPRRVARQAMAIAQQTMASLSQDTELFQVKLVEFANEKRIPELIAGLSIISGVSNDEVEQLFYSPNELGMLVFCKSLGFDWQRAEMLILATPNAQNYEQEQLDELQTQYDKLSAASAQRLLRFWQGRQAVVKAMAKKTA